MIDKPIMFQRSERSERSTPLITSHTVHTINLSQRQWNQDHMVFISIDPGINNFAFRIELRPKNGLPPHTIVFNKLNFSNYRRDNETSLYCMVTTFLDMHMVYFRKVHVVLIERQLPINYQMVRLCQHLISYFVIRLKNLTPLLPLILEISPRIKTRYLDSPKGMNSKQVKRWSIEMALNLLKDRGDTYAYGVITNAAKNKKDDLADTIVQLEAICKMLGWA